MIILIFEVYFMITQYLFFLLNLPMKVWTESMQSPFLRSMSTYFQAGEPRALSMNSNIKSHLLPKNRSIHGHGFDVWRDRELEIARVT